MPLLRQFLTRAGVLLVAVACAACITVDVGHDTGPQSQYRIVDSNPAAAARAQSLGRELLVAPIPNSAVDDSFSLAFSRAPNQRAAYQFATWSDRPSNRLAHLLVERLATRGTFNSVALLGRGVGGDLQVNLTVNDFYHDAATSPGTARIAVTAELVNRTTRKLIARQRFTATSPVEQANAASAAAALSRASTLILDQLVTWAEATAAPAALASVR
jgi:cholesterol transport system auxiliary component